MSSTITEQLQPLLPMLARMLSKRQSPATVWRWTTHGIKVGDHRVKLRALKIGGRLYGTQEDVQRFIDEQNTSAVEDDAENDTERSRRLESAGLL
jgi:hypothetical protein